jgi:hypothetical protein
MHLSILLLEGVNLCLLRPRPHPRLCPRRPLVPHRHLWQMRHLLIP